MHLDPLTLMFGNCLVACASAGLLLIIWMGDRQAAAALVWACGNLCRAAAIGCLAFAARPSPAISLLSVMLFCGADGLLLAGTLVLQNREPFPLTFIAVFAVALLLNLVGSLGYAPSLVVAMSQAVPCLFILAAAIVLWQGRHERLKARLPAIAFMGVHATVVAIVIPAALTASQGLAHPSPSGLFGIIHFETVIFVMAITVLMTSMLRERREIAERSRALKDELTDLPNRRGFLLGAELVLAEAAASGASVSLLMFDLDHFKRVNDTYGHLVGDEVLTVFGRVLQTSLRETDVIGRLGGEEFAAILPGTDLDRAVALADRVRADYADAARTVRGRPVRGTVTAGAAAGKPGRSELPALLQSADEALYIAKSIGRNRVHPAAEQVGRSTNIVRIA